MPEVYKRLYQGQPGIAAATIYTVPALTQVVVKHIRAVNQAGPASTIGLFHGGTAVANRIHPDVLLNQGEWYEDDVLLTMLAAETLAAIASVAATITLTVYGIELS